MSENRESQRPFALFLGSMSLDPVVCYRALRTRDARFDGRFFTAVRSTGVYCRPICPAPTPRLENCLFVPCAAAAQEAGFRPCLRCRPEASPGTPAWRGTSATVSRALRLIDEGALDTSNVEALAARVGVGGRHLRRLFLDHVGAAPRTVAQTRRLLFAKQLIDETDLPMAQIAFAAGFSSVRRFNEAVRETYARSPGEIRRGAGRRARADAGEVCLRLAYREPYAWEATLAYLAARATPGVEAATERTYARAITLDDVGGVVEIERIDGEPALRARIRLERPVPLIRVAERVRALFDLSADPSAVEDVLGASPPLRRALRALPGLRVPGAWDGFELTVRAILGQQVSVAGATTLAGRLAAAHGAPLAPGVAVDASIGRSFPSAEALADADLEGVGLTRARAHAVRSLAQAVARDGLRIEPGEDPEATLDALRALPGIGEWTAQYVAMRALREPDAFPAGDLVLRKRMGLDARALEAASLAWRPWRAYAAMALWLGGEPGRAPRKVSARSRSARLRT
jgi:AraC family transcriptional regulator of adaptative response / DNA-3-methyladenine glycosylase II